MHRWHRTRSRSSGPAIYNLASSAATGRLLAGQTTSITSTIMNVGVATADAANYTVLTAVVNSGTIDPASGLGAVASNGGTGSFANTYTATGLTGPVTITPTVASAVNATLGGNATLGAVAPATINVLAARTMAAPLRWISASNC